MASSLKVSINPGLLNKNESGESSMFVSGFANVEFTPHELAASINTGAAFCAQLTRDHRSAKNFLCAGVLAVDVDGTRTIEDALADPFVKQHLTILYKTPSHTEEEHRFRLVFALPEPIFDPKAAAAATRALTLRLAGDSAATDAARISFGSRDSNPQVFDGCLTPEIVSGLIETGSRQNVFDNVVSKTYGTNISTQAIPDDLIVRRANGDSASFKGVGPGVTIHCPFHHDVNASAFTVSSRSSDAVGIHCSSCGLTYWPPNTSSDYDFLDFDDSAKRAHEYFEKNKTLGSFQWALDDLGHHVHPGLKESNIYVTEQEFVQPLKERNGLFFYKSPKGTGKTVMLQQLLDKDDKTAVLIGHRVALIRQTCEKLNLDCYQDLGHPPQTKRLGICLDSLGRLVYQEKLFSGQTTTQRKLFDTVIIDESEQVLQHFLSSTISAEDRQKIFHIFTALLRHAKRIIALDADLSWLSFETLTKLAAKEDNERKSYVILNEFKTPKRMTFFESDGHLLEDLIVSMRDGKRIFVTSNSRRHVNMIDEAIKAAFPEAKTIAITRDNSQGKEAQAFIVNPGERAYEYQAILTSPSLGTGVDITFPNREKVIDVVYGFFFPQITTHFDFDQQISRVRHPGAVKVAISPRRFTFDTAVDVIKRDIQQQNLFKCTIVGYDDEDLRPIYHTDDPLIDMAALIVSQQRASKNNLKRNFLSLKQHQGYEIDFVQADEELQAIGSQRSSDAYDAVLSHRIADLMSAPTLNKAQLKDFDNRVRWNEDVSAGERLCAERTMIELFYRQPLSADLVKKDNFGGLRTKVKRYENLLSYAENANPETEMSEFRKKMSSHGKRFLADESSSAGVLYGLLCRTPIFDGRRFVSDFQYSRLDLDQFCDELAKVRKTVEKIFDYPVPVPKKRDGVTLLHGLLRQIGLAGKKISKSKAAHLAGGDTIYFYNLDIDQLAKIDGIRNRRQKVRGWDAVSGVLGYPADAEEGDMPPFLYTNPKIPSLMSPVG